ncbi:bifunctional diguanylate cyclase/phosphodiesterase [Celerinatantimonas sp. YJH-8]|uniref:bifunctional diguanylate cyclase/phosphodiesterase n=1 Tax=Celerinatantimonas sp. YJH-8 TaxID=3228714 RepID=UPI0038C277A4
MSYTGEMVSIAHIIRKQKITILFQPIWDHFKQQVLGYEALSRGPSNSPYHLAVPLFENADKQGVGCELEWLCAELAVQRANQIELTGKLFINLSPQALFQDIPGSYARLKEWQRDRPLVIELTENTPFSLNEEKQQLLAKLRRLQIEIAIDDFGSGYAGLQTLLEVEPDYVKLDGFFADTLLKHPHTMTLIELVVGVADHLNAVLIAEKIEDQEQLEQFAGLNIHLYQGFLIQKPAIYPQSLTHMLDLAYPSNEEPYTAASLLHSVPSVLPSLSSHELLQQMRHDKHMTYVAVTNEQGTVLGIVRREELLELHSGPFGHSLHQRTTVADLMDDAPIVVESYLPLSEIGRRLSHSDATGLDSAFVIIRQGIYQGLGYALELMRRLSDYKLQLARYANPLTMLPGNVPLHRTLQTLMNGQEGFEVAYFDLNNFKPFNDCCGYERGDQMIRLVAQLLTQYLRPYARFIGHLGGDDFIVIFCNTQDWYKAVKQIQKTFSERSRALYRHQDILHGGIVSQDRNGEEKFFPLTQLACGVTCWNSYLGPSLEKLSEIASYAKKQAKAAQDHYFYYELKLSQLI